LGEGYWGWGILGKRGKKRCSGWVMVNDEMGGIIK
jgi:hypothetical protein